jgi:antirestriction protein
MTGTLRIYIADLAEYNNGNLHGGWIDCEGKDAGDLLQEIKDRKLVKMDPYSSPDDPEMNEFAIHDHEGFGDLVGEYDGLDFVANLVEKFDALHDPDNWGLFREWLKNSGDYDKDAEDFEDAYQGTFESLGHWAEQFEEDTGSNDIPERLKYYIDYDAIGRDAQLGGDIFTIDHGGEVAVFWNH